MPRSRRNHYGWSGYRPYVSAAERKRESALESQRARARGQALDPVRIEARRIATTTWGRAWCDHIEGFRDYENRLPRGRTYVRNGSVLHLELRRGEILAKVMGSELYEQRIELEPCKPAVWKRLRERCAGGIGSLIELLEGRISSEVMTTMTARDAGLLPDLKQVRMECSCPDWAALCKHLAAVLYGVGARLDDRPELLFVLRGVDPTELVDGAVLPGQGRAAAAGTRTVEGDLASVFGIELEELTPPDAPSAPPEAPRDEPIARRSRAASGAGKRSRSAAPPRRAREETVRRQELLQAGVPAGTICTWLYQGVLLASAERGVYRHTPASRTRLKQYAT